MTDRYSDLFCLDKRDLWKALGDYPEARQSLMERGCQILRKDGLLDEEAFRRAQEENETLKEKVERIGESHSMILACTHELPRLVVGKLVIQ